LIWKNILLVRISYLSPTASETKPIYSKKQIKMKGKLDTTEFGMIKTNFKIILRLID